MEVIRERLTREFNLDLISTASLSCLSNDTQMAKVGSHNPADMPEVTRLSSIEEPWIKATIMTPDDFQDQF